jgi:hypothetical protein
MGVKLQSLNGSNIRPEANDSERLPQRECKCGLSLMVGHSLRDPNTAQTLTITAPKLVLMAAGPGIS